MLATELDSDLKRISSKNCAVSVQEQILITLNFFACGAYLRCIGDMMGLHKSSISRIVHKVCCAIARMRSRYIRMPITDEEKQYIARCFYNIAKFPNCIGAIDCTHIPIQSIGGNDGENFRNRKGVFSYNVQVVADSQMLIRNIVARWPGSTHDSHIFNSSTLKGNLEDGMFDPYCLVGDSGYASKPYMFVPHPDPQTNGQKLYNESQIRTRNVVERLFGSWKRRFPIIGTKLRLKKNRIQPVIVATAVLHNICKKMNDIEPPETIVQLISELENIEEYATAHQSDDRSRDDLIRTYFNR
ncbi:Putative nuclease HARBI1 [Eumeta japonica]|uniref:Putative nuclease HARBI1 n=1 Tax=Eumeta variegata TaxID=151549 RepID=A0A4C1UAD6_EUMVA|nr:Putative nuclease HARBI1 [Eumeta japonica]